MPGNDIFLPQVTRIPITGSDQYNTLVCVSASDYIRSANIGEIGKLQRTSQSITTPFKLFGLLEENPPVAPVFDHSTTAWLSSIGPTNNGDWTIAVDSVTGAGFSPYDASFYVNIDTACMPCMVPLDNCYPLFGFCLWEAIVCVTSFVLCYEPPAATKPHDRRHLKKFEKRAINAPAIPPLNVGTAAEILLRGLGGGRAPGTGFRAPAPAVPPGEGNGRSPCACKK